MSKINIKYTLKNVTENKTFSNECIGIKNDNKIKFKDNNIIVIITILENELEMYRKCNDYEIIIPISLNQKKGLYKIKGLGNLNLDVISDEIIIDNNSIKITYNMIIDQNNPQKFNYFIEYYNL